MVRSDMTLLAWKSALSVMSPKDNTMFERSAVRSKEGTPAPNRRRELRVMALHSCHLFSSPL